MKINMLVMILFIGSMSMAMDEENDFDIQGRVDDLVADMARFSVDEGSEGSVARAIAKSRGDRGKKMYKKQWTRYAKPDRGHVEDPEKPVRKRKGGSKTPVMHPMNFRFVMLPGAYPEYYNHHKIALIFLFDELRDSNGKQKDEDDIRKKEDVGHNAECDGSSAMYTNYIEERYDWGD